MPDYPTETELARVREWPMDDPTGWFAFVRSIGHWWAYVEPWGWHEYDGLLNHGPARWYIISTGGWSGNEEIIAAMRVNAILWSLTWQQSNRGGHYRFAVRKEAVK